jgi:hypothetical protein
MMIAPTSCNTFCFGDNRFKSMCLVNLKDGYCCLGDFSGVVGIDLSHGSSELSTGLNFLISFLSALNFR